jgi:D-alanine transaminase
MKQYATDHDAFETVMLRDGHLTEGSSANIMVVKDGRMIAPRRSHQILPGITCDTSYLLAQEHGLALELRPVTEAEVRNADELWLSSSGREVLPITTLDGRPVGDGVPGPVYKRMWSWFQAAKRADAKRWQERKAARARGTLAA